ncbi:prepilin-type N-terminal cleavage/methylation domain-containing protein [Trinickia fusca]|uniref:Shufflon system plasmid conjugative transfer pilus tip adhesin PilV n=1 Tax=Trinickia fusca TaxID=2419777 RepID=A0A494X930_9BURK|nr:prepilin-type N-terminal cleavage/methylation domain-containing protein [Trinickia fusca]RKP44589.1 hypothetical protein D7S89_22205 [Trinickia fusca]
MHRSRSFAARSRQRGITLVEALAALFIAALMFAGLSMLINTSMKNLRDQQAAQYQAQLANAAMQLVQANYATLASQAAATAARPVVVPLRAAVGAIQLASYLPASIQGANAYGQSPCLLVTAQATGGLDALLVTEGGQTIPDLELGYIAANAGQGGGSIPSKNGAGAANANGAAYGAYGAWINAAPDTSGANCSGQATGVGHLVSEVFTTGPGNQNADFLYRVRVPGYADANTMHAPIYLHDSVAHVEGSSDEDCKPGLPNSVGKITSDANGRVLSCQSSGTWQFAGSSYWRDPVASSSNLSSLSNPQQGDVALALDTGIPWEYTGTAWHSLILDNNNNLVIGDSLLVASRLDLTQQNVIGTSCADDSKVTSATGKVSMNAAGEVLSCQNGKWENQSQINPYGSDADCVIIMGNPGAHDYDKCSYRYSGPYPNGDNPSYDAAAGNYSYKVTRKVMLAKPGIISVAAWAHMYDEICRSGQNNFHNMGQVALYVTITDNDTGHVIGNSQSQSPTITDDSAGINENVTQAAPANQGGYNIVIQTDWANYNGLKTPYETNYCGPKGDLIQTTPVAAGWTINSFY